MRTVGLIAFVLFLSSCASGMKREGQCLATLTPEFLHAQTELAALEASWRSAPYQISVRQDQMATAGVVTNPLLSNGVPEAGAPKAETIVQQAQAKYRATRLRYRSTLEWYDRVYQRVRTRIEEEQLLSEVFWTLVTGPGLVFYPIVQWNVHSVMWDGIDPDADSDPIRRFCSDLESQKGAGSVGGP
jgi:hypothetical protein